MVVFDISDNWQIVTMPRSQLEIITSSVIRLVKEEASYHRELEQQTERVKKLEAGQGGDDEENKEYLLKQEVCIHPSNSFAFVAVLSSMESNRS